MPRLAAFPKAFMQALCKEGTMSVSDWIQLAAPLEIQGLEWYAGFLEMADESNWSRFRREVEITGKVIPMMCCSPDFTHPDPDFRAREIAKQKRWIDMTHALGGQYCRVLSGQRRPGLPIEEGVKFAADSITACLPHAANLGITLILENHYKDDFWEYPEFAQKMDIFCQLTDAVQHPNFGVNYDPSNTYLAGEDPIELLKRVSHRVVTMHASDRYLINSDFDEGLQIYLDGISKLPRPSAEEEAELLNRMQAGDHSARSEIIKAYCALVVKIATDHEGQGLTMLNLISHGNVGLNQATKQFRPNRAGSFSTYAAARIRRLIRLALRKQKWGKIAQGEDRLNDVKVSRRAADGNWDGPDCEVLSVNRLAKFLPQEEPGPKDIVRKQSVSNRLSPKKLSQQQLDLLADPSTGYSKNLRHGEIGQGLNDYDAIFTELKRVGFDGWISIEDGVDGMDQLARSVGFLKQKIAQYWPGET